MLYYANARSAFLTDAWLWWVLPPGICIAGVVLGFALIGYALEERARPRLRTVGGGRAVLPSVEHTRSRSRRRPGRSSGPPSCRQPDRRVRHRERTLRVVDGVSLSIRRGEALGIVGESGSGKTTLVTTVLGLLRTPARITSGSVRLAGKDLATLRPPISGTSVARRWR